MMFPSAADLNYFLEVCHALNFSRAAERLGISQPSLSMAIKRLEQSIGTALFIRHKQGVTLTQSGKSLRVHASELLTLWDKTKAQALSAYQDVRGTYTIGCHSAVAGYFMAAILPKLLSDYPQLELNLKHDLSRKINEEIVNLSVDIGVVVNPYSHPDLVIRQLFTDAVGFWRPDCVAAKAELKQNKAVIICDLELTQTQTLLKKLKQQGLSYQRMVTTSSLEVAAQLALQGAGIAILPQCVATSCSFNRLQPLTNTPVYHDKVCLVYRHENRQVAAIQRIRETILSSMEKTLKTN